MNGCDTENCMCVATMCMTTLLDRKADNRLAKAKQHRDTHKHKQFVSMALGKLDSQT